MFLTTLNKSTDKRYWGSFGGYWKTFVQRLLGSQVVIEGVKTEWVLKGYVTND